MLFKVDEVLLIENLTYFEEDFPFTGILNAKGLTVAEYLNRIDMEQIVEDKDYASYMTGNDFRNLILAIQNNPKIMACYIADTHLDSAYGGGGGVSAVFINEELEEAVVAFRGTAANEWTDDFVASNQVDSLQQINALEWYKKIYEEYDLKNYRVTVTGHSKGGNKAKYITILNDTPHRCISFDGQGFSDIFFDYYKERILERQDKITNHNVDYDYVNILLNDIGRKTYYFGYDYGRGGFAEAHCPNTFFDFGENGSYKMRPNPNGQRPEMQILDQFINSMSRSDVSEAERCETSQLLGILIEKAFAIGSDENNTATDYITFLCDLIRDPKYSNNTAYLLAFIIKYSQQNPSFLQALKDIMTHFNMTDFIKVIDMLEEIVGSKKLDRIVNLSNFLVLHVNGIVTKTVQSVAKKKFDIELTKDQVKGVLTIISMTKGMLKTLELDMDGSDIVLEEDDDEKEESYTLPENLEVVILTGGLSTQRNISISSAFEIAEALKEKGHKPIILDSFMGYGDKEEVIENAFLDCEKYSLKVDELSDELADLWAVKKRRMDKSNVYFGPNVLQICKQADIVFIALQGANGENGKVQATFDLLGIEYTGCDYFSSAVTTNKNIAKQVLVNNGIPVSKGFGLRKGMPKKNPEDYDLQYPLIIKPCNGDLGLGISLASDKKAYDRAVKEAFRWEKELVVEEYVLGREFAVSTINGKALPVIECLPLNTKDKDTDLSLSGEVIKKCPADIPQSLAKKLQKAAEKAAECLGMREYSLSDFIVRKDGSFVCLECDSLPEFAKDSYFTTEAIASGMSFADMIETIIILSLSL